MPAEFRAVGPNLRSRPKSRSREGFVENSIIMEKIKICFTVQTEISRKLNLCLLILNILEQLHFK
jgi:hypothetical protein